MKEVFINLIRIWPEKPITLRGTLSRSSIIFEAGTMYGLEILHECGEIVKTKIQKVLGPNPYVCRGFRGKTGGVIPFAS